MTADYTTDKRAVLIHNIEDMAGGWFCPLGETVEVLEGNKDIHSPSGYSYLVKHGYEGRLFHVDSKSLISYKEWTAIYNRIARMLLENIQREGVLK